MRKPNYSLDTHKSINNGLFLNNKQKKMRHMQTYNLWPTENREFFYNEVKDKIQLEIEMFKASIYSKYPRIMAHTVQFSQKPDFGCNYNNPDELKPYSFIVSRTYDYDYYDLSLYNSRRFSDSLLEKFTSDCLKNGLRVVLEEQQFRDKTCLFIIIADTGVDLQQAYDFALTLPKK
jgi:hypothetical protein